MLGIIILCDKEKTDLNAHLDACVCVCVCVCTHMHAPYIQN